LDREAITASKTLCPAVVWDFCGRGSFTGIIRDWLEFLWQGLLVSKTAFGLRPALAAARSAVLDY
jgi:hypothetical protein